METLNPDEENPLEHKRHRHFLEDDLAFHSNTINVDGFDREYFEEIKSESEVVKETSKETSKIYEPWNDLHLDIFGSLYKYSPKLHKENDVQVSRLMNRKLMSDVIKAPKYRELRALTRLDKINSSIGTEILGQEVREQIEKMEEERKALKELQKTAEELKEQLEGEGDKETDAPGGKGKGGKKMTLKEAKALLEEARDQFDSAFKKEAQASEINRMLDRVIDETQTISDMIQNWGLEQGEGFEQRPYQEKIALINKIRNNEKLQRIAQLAGRYRMLAMKAQREKIKHGIDELYSIEQGSNLNRTIPSELMKLGHRSTKTLFYADYVGGKLLQYSLKGRERKGKGPIIVAIDESGSMSGLPDEWAKSVALAILEIAKSQKRSMIVIHFDATYNPKHLHVNKFYKNKPYSIEDIIDMAEHFAGGGTLFEPALNLARQYIDEEKDFEKADIVFITDGQCAVRDKWLEEFLRWKEKRKVTIRSVLIDSYSHTAGTLNEFSDEVEHLHDLKADSKDPVAITLFESF